MPTPRCSAEVSPAPGTFVMMMGTSTCHLLMADAERPVEGHGGRRRRRHRSRLFCIRIGTGRRWRSVRVVRAPRGSSHVPCGCGRAGRVDSGAAHRACGRSRAGKQRPSRTGLVAGESFNARAIGSERASRRRHSQYASGGRIPRRSSRRPRSGHGRSSSRTRTSCCRSHRSSPEEGSPATPC